MKSTNGVQTSVELFDDGEVAIKLYDGVKWVRATYEPSQARELSRVLTRAARLAESITERSKKV